MLKLSVLIAALDEQQLEASLVSVLQNRPRDCEIVVVRDEGYDDPYDLAGEVCFAFTPPRSDLLTRLNHGIQLCNAPVLNILTRGTEVVEGWAEPAVSRFDDPQVAAVAPLLTSADRTRIIAAGLDYHRGGARVACHAGAAAAERPATTHEVLGPSLEAGFYRTRVLQSVGAPFRSGAGENHADIDLDLRLHDAGWRAVLESRSLALLSSKSRYLPLSDAWCAERLYWQHAGCAGHCGSLGSHVAVLTAELAATLVRPWQAAKLLGRAAGWLEHWFTRGQQIEAFTAAAGAMSSVEDEATLPIDRARIERARARHSASRAA